mgnify:CR=1 FL=1
MLRWSLTMDKHWFINTTLKCLVMLTLMFLIFTIVVNFNNKTDGIQPYVPCMFMVVLIFTLVVVLGPVNMFNNMKGQSADQTLLMLPASNLEKYLVRYSYWILLLPCLLVAFVVADLLQYVGNWVTGHEWRTLLMLLFFSPDTHIHVGAGSLTEGLASLYFNVHLFWTHSVYAVGVMLFRSHKYNWIYTSIALIVGAILLASAVNLIVSYDWGLQFERWAARFIVNPGSKFHYLWNGLVLCLAAFNFWLSYRLFSRMQVRGRFINI